MTQSLAFTAQRTSVREALGHPEGFMAWILISDCGGWWANGEKNLPYFPGRNALKALTSMLQSGKFVPACFPALCKFLVPYWSFPLRSTPSPSADLPIALPCPLLSLYKPYSLRPFRAVFVPGSSCSRSSINSMEHYTRLLSFSSVSPKVGSQKS